MIEKGHKEIEVLEKGLLEKDKLDLLSLVRPPRWWRRIGEIMPKTGSYIHSSIHTGLTISCTNAYATTRKHAVSLADEQNYPQLSYQIGTLYLHLDTIAGATSVTIRICRDAAGDQAVIGDTTATISTGISTATEGDVTFLINSLYKHSDTNLFVFFKTNAGTCNVKKIELSFKE